MGAQALHGGIGLDRGERDRRHRAVRARMRAAGLDALIVPHATGDWDNLQPDTRYLSTIGGWGTATSLVFPLEGEPVAAVREERRAEWWRTAQDWVADVRAPPDLDWGRFFVDALRERGLAGGRVGVVGLDCYVREPRGILPAQELQALRDAFPGARFVSATDLMVSVRKIKSAAEIALVERAQACADAVGAAFLRARPGDRLPELYAEMTAAGLRLGGEAPSMLLMGCDRTLWQTHLGPERRAIAADDVLVLEAEPKFEGYAAQSVATLAMRGFDATERDLLEASRDCFDAMLDAMRPGRPYADLFPIWRRLASGRDRQPGRSFGHGTGLGQDRPWTTRAGILGGGDPVMEVGDCFILKPWVSDRQDRTAARVGATVVVEAGGARALSDRFLAPTSLTNREAFHDPS